MNSIGIEEIFIICFVIQFAIVFLVTLAEKLSVAYPIVLVLGGLILGFVPGMPRVAVQPSLIFLIFLPPAI
ncbi:hypothetical protein [Arcticibacter sp. MXS-1]|uniref:hypothetical protein n=1 Tax=Arcticibacter sp. MXS-1 TaxID=3341726 RepID=UPI0035A911CC